MNDRLDQRRGVEHLGVWEFSRDDSWGDFCASIIQLLEHEPTAQGATLEQVRAITHPEDLSHLEDLVSDVKAGERRDIEARWRAKCADGRWRHVLTRARPHGAGRAVFGVHLDMTELVETQSELQRREEDFRRIVEHANEGIGILDEKQVIHFVNREFAEILGMRSNELMGRKLQDFIDERDWEVLQRQIERRKVGERSRYELRMKRSDGATRWVSVSGAPILEGAGGFRGSFAMVRDVTERHAVERRLRESEQRYRTLFESTIDAVFVMEGERFVDGNRRTEEMFGATREDLVGCTPFGFSPELQPDGERSEVKGRRYLERALDGEAQVFYWTHERSDGTPFDAEVSLTRVTFDERFLVLAFVRDISERRKVERDRERLERQLRHSQKMEAVGQLAGGVAHDFNNLLQAISGYTELIEQDVEDGHPALANVAEISRAAERATALTRQLLTFSRREELNQKPVYIDALVADLARLVRRLIGEHIELTLAPGPGVSPVLADRGQIEQVVLNLCVNARDAMPEGGRVEIETRDVELDEAFCERFPVLEPGRHVLLRVSDNGLGIPDDVKERIFEPFFTTKDVGEGTGLGLATAYAVAERHMGAIACESRVGAGATFRLYLPVVEEAVVTATKERRKRLDLGGHETILVAEDEPAVRALAVTVLRGAGYRVISAEDGAEAMRLIDEHASEIDLALLDIVMPRRGGPQVAARLLDERPDVPIIFSSGYAMGVSDSRNLPGGSLPKPYRPSELLELVRSTLDKTGN